MTSTLSVTAPTRSVRSTRWRALTATGKASATEVENPTAAASSMYVPAFTSRNSKLPAASDRDFAAIPVFTFRSVTAAPETTPPLESRIVPNTAAVSNCAWSKGARNASAAAQRITMVALRDMGILR